LFNINTFQSVSNLKTVLNDKRTNACIFSQKNGDIHIYKATSCGDYFNACSVDIISFQKFQKFSVQNNYEENFEKERNSNLKKNQENENKKKMSNSQKQLNNGGIVEKSSFLLNDSDSDGNLHCNNKMKSLENVFNENMANNESEDIDYIDFVSCIVAYSGQDLCVFRENGVLESRIDSSLVIDGISCYTISVQQKLLFCLFDSGKLCVFCLMGFEGRLLVESNVFYHSQNDKNKDNYQGDNDSDYNDENKKNYHDKGRALCMVLVDETLDEAYLDCVNNHSNNDNKKIKNNGEIIMNKKPNNSTNMYDLRNEILPKNSENRNLEEMLLIGTDRGILHGFNTISTANSNDNHNHGI
jgi:hypothetical protein